MSILNAKNSGLVAGDSSSPVMASNTIIFQALLDDVPADGGYSIFIPPGTYYLDNTGIVVRRTVHLFGSLAVSTILVFPSGCIAIYFQSGDVEVQPGKPGDSQFSIMENLTLQGSASSPQYDEVVNPNGDHGIQLQAGVVTLRHVHVFNFGGDGIRSDAGVGIPTGHNTSSSQSRIENCFCGQNHGWGFNIHDGDNNSAILMTSPLAQSNAAGDINEGSFLGNTYVGGGSHGELGGFKVTAQGNGTNKSTFLGFYHEGPELSKVDEGSIAVGGGLSSQALYYPDNTGVIISGDGCKNLRSRIYKHCDPEWYSGAAVALNDYVRPSLPNANGRRYKAVYIGNAPHHTGPTEPTWPKSFGGGQGGPGQGETVVDGDITWKEDGPLATVLDWSAYVDLGQHFAFALHDATAPTADYVGFLRTEGQIGGWDPYWWAHAWAGNFADINAQTFFISTPDSKTGHAYTGRGIFNVNKLFLGNLYHGKLFLDVGSAPPPTLPGNGPRWQGDFRFNSTPVAGGVAGWVCVTAGNPGTWMPVYLPGTYEAQTTTNSANQVIATHSLPVQAASMLVVSVVGNKKDTDDFVTAKLEISAKRNASGHPIRAGSDDVTIKKTGGLAISDVNGIHLEINTTSGSIEAQVNPGETATLDWTVVVNATEVMS
jgi:hypothetical protein